MRALTLPLLIVLLAFTVLPGQAESLLVEDPLPGLTQNGQAGPTADIGQERFRRLSLDAGLSQVSINAIAQDTQGFVWIGTQDGLNRYDGVTFRIFKPDPDEPGSLADQFVTALAAGPDGELWVGMNVSGLDRFDPQTGQFVHYRMDSGDKLSLGDDHIRGILVSRDGTVWIGTGNGLNRFNPQTNGFELFLHGKDDPAGLGHQAVWALFEDSRGDLWVGTGNGLNRLEHGSSRSTHYRHDPADPASLIGEKVQAIFEDDRGVLWVGTELGLNRMERATGAFSHFVHDPQNPYSLTHNDITAIYQDRLGILWVGTRGGGLNWLDRQTGRFHAHHTQPGDLTSLSSEFVSELFEDQSGVMWVGTEAAGLNLLPRLPERFRHYIVDSSGPDGEPGKVDRSLVWSVYADPSGSLWLGTQGGGLSRYERPSGHWTHYMHDPDDPSSIGGDIIYAITGDADGKLWLAVEKVGLERFDPLSGKVIQRYTHIPDDPASLADECPTTLLMDRRGGLWVGTHEGGADRLDLQTGQISHYPIESDEEGYLRGPFVWSIHEARDGTIWFGTAGGVNLLDPTSGKFTYFSHAPDDPDSLSNNLVMSILEDSRGWIWVGTLGGGLNRLDRETGKFIHFTEKDGLPNNVVYGILEDEQGRLWMSTNNGLASFDPELVDAKSVDLSNTPSDASKVTLEDIRLSAFQSFGPDDGLQSREFNSGSYFRSASGEMSFGGVNGFNTFDPQQAMEGNSYQPPVALVGLTRGGEALELDQPVERSPDLTLRWPDNSFEFEFVGLSYIYPEQNQYAYRLEGFEEEWNYVGGQRFGRYTNLPGGTYTLRVKAANNDGVWNEQGTALTLTVVPPFWQTVWFQVVLGLGLAGVVVAAYRLRVREIKLRNQELEQLVDARTAELATSAQKLEGHSRELEALYHEEQRRSGQFQTLAEVGRRIGPLLDADEAIQEVVRLLQLAFGYYHVGIGLVEGEAVVYRYGAGALWDDPAFEFKPRRLRIGKEGMTGWVAANGKPLLARDVRQEPNYVCMQGSATQSELVVPILAKDQIIGVLDAQSDRLDGFDETDLAVLQTIAHQVGAAIENARLYEQAQQAAVLQERSRLARELHDAVTQTLFSASLLAEALPSAWETDPEEGQRLMRELRQLNRGALAEMRSLLMELRPSALVEANLADLLRQLAEAASGREGIPVNVTVDGRCASIPADVHIALYRIAQEALNNVVKHARASQATMRLRCYNQPDRNGGSPAACVALTVSDDGRGFNVNGVPPDHMGLRIMRERAQAVGATLEIESRPGQGTQLTALWESGEIAEGEETTQETVE